MTQTLPTDRDARKASPMFSGLLAYFPNALAGVAALSKSANDFHNPGEPIHWSFDKSNDHEDCLVRHLVDAGEVDTDGIDHSAKVAWRALAMYEAELIARGAKPGRNVRREPPGDPNLVVVFNPDAPNTGPSSINGAAVIPTALIVPDEYCELGYLDEDDELPAGDSGAEVSRKPIDISVFLRSFLCTPSGYFEIDPLEAYMLTRAEHEDDEILIRN